jgi:hypothetical protein
MRRVLFALLMILAGARYAEAQGTIYNLSPPAPNAQLRVCPSPDNGYPCPVTAAIFSDVGLTQSIPQPVQLGPSGFATFYIASGTYVIQLSGPGYNSSNRQTVSIGGGGSGTGFPVTTPVTVGNGGSITTTGTGTITATSGGNAASTMAVVQALGTASGGTLVGAYLMLPTETPASLVDYSIGGVGAATGTVGTAPTIVSVTGGINCTGNGAVILPAALNSNGAKPALTMYVYASINTTAAASFSNSGGTVYGALIAGNGGGALSNNIDLLLSNQFNGIVNQAGGAQILLESNNSFGAGAMASSFNGTGSIAMSISGSGTALSVNGISVTDCALASGLCTIDIHSNQTTGAYQLCGTAAGSGLGSQSYLIGKEYVALFFSANLTAGQIKAVDSIIANYMTSRGVAPAYGVQPGDTTDNILLVGDSITGSNGVATPWSSFIFTASAPFTLGNITNNGMPALTANAIRQSLPMDTCVYVRPAAARSIVHLWAGTNDIAVSARTAAQTWADLAASAGLIKKLCPGNPRIVVATMLSRASNDTGKNALNALIRQNWRVAGFDGLNDIAADALLGADGASAGSGFQGDGIHPNQAAYANNVSMAAQREINSLVGNTDFSTGNTYAATTTAAIATTAGSEATNTVTITVASGAPPQGACVVIAGVTPAGYNSPTTTGQLPCWHVLTSNGTTSFTYFNPTSGLGAISVQGTVLTPQELDVDEYATLGGAAAAPSHVLQSCIGRTGQPIFRRVTNTNASPWVITPIISTETINGGATFTTPAAAATNNPIIRLEPILTSAPAAGCTWKADIQ